MIPRQHLAAFTFLLATTLGSTRALADDSPAIEPAPAAAEASQKTESQWYGYQTLGVDGLALGVGALAPSSGAGFATAAITTYLVGAPVIHLVHGSPGKALGDLAIRAGAPIAGACIGGVIGILAARSNDGVARLEGMEVGGAYGLVAGVGLAVALDAIVLARRDAAPARESAAAAPPARTAQSARIMPTVAPTSGGATAGVVGAF